MRYEMISADCHVDLCWLPPTLFTDNASSAMRERMPYVADGPNGRRWTTKSGANLGLENGMGSGGRQYMPGKIHRADRIPHPDGIWPDSKEYVARELGHLPAATRRKIVCENAARLYGFKLT